MRNQNVTETIDPSILGILGINDTFDLDYDEYDTLLKEAIVKRAFGSNKLSQEALAILSNERKRIRNKKSTTFASKKTRINVSNFSNLKVLKKPKNLKIQTIPRKSTEIVQVLASDLNDINRTLTNLLGAITEQNKLEEKSSEEEIKKKEDEKRKKKESRLETILKPIKEVAKKVLAPLQGILDKIVKFILFTLLGRAFKAFVDWAKDPKNKEKLQNLGRFLKDWWPILLGAWFFFANPLGRFIKTIIGTVAKLSFKLAKFAIPRLVSFIGKNPLVAAGLATGAAAGIGYLSEKNRLDQTAKERGELPQKIGEGNWFSEIGRALNPGQLGMGGISPFGLSKGGSVFSGLVGKEHGVSVSGAGPDTQYFPVAGGGGAVLQPGETVLQVGARERMIQEAGVDPLAYNVGAGANVPRRLGNNLVGNSFGGLIGMKNGGVVGKNQNLWATAAIAAKEAGSLAQGQADVAQSIYNRAKMGIYPGGSDIRSIITAPGQYEPTFKNPDAWKSIVDRNTAAQAVGKDYISRLDMAIKNLSNPILQKNSANFIGSRSDFMGESQKKYMKPEKGDITRGLGHNFFGWMTDTASNLKLSKAAPIPSFIPKTPSQQKSQSKPKEEPNIFQRLTSGVSSMFTKPERKEEQKLQSGGRVIQENTGSDYAPDGNRLEGADRQYMGFFAQPGETHYIFTKKATERGASNLADIIQAKLDPNSSAAKRTIPGPPARRRGSSSATVLSPITQKSGSGLRSSARGAPNLPRFSTTSSSAYETRLKNAEMYGIV